MASVGRCALRSQHDRALALFTPRVRCQALASISHVARLSVLSKRRDAPCAFRAHYADGVLIPAPGARGGDASAAPQPCAAVDGTTITVEDLFHNMTIRRRALRSPAEQYQRILEVVTRYAIHFGVRGVAFTCTKHGAPSADLHVTAAAAASRRNVIRLVCVQSVVPPHVVHACSSTERHPVASALAGTVPRSSKIWSNSISNTVTWPKPIARP